MTLQPWNPGALSTYHCGLDQAWTYSLEIQRQCLLTIVGCSRFGPAALKSHGSVIFRLWPKRVSYSLEIPRQCRFTTVACAGLRTTALKSRGSVFLPVSPEWYSNLQPSYPDAVSFNHCGLGEARTSTLRSRVSVFLPLWLVQGSNIQPRNSEAVSSYNCGLSEARTYSLEIYSKCLLTTAAWSSPWNPEAVSSCHCGLSEAQTYSLEILKQCCLSTVAWGRLEPTALRSRGSIFLPLWPRRGSNFQPLNPEAVSSYHCGLGKARTYSLEIPRQCLLTAVALGSLEPTALKVRGNVFLSLWIGRGSNLQPWNPETLPSYHFVTVATINYCQYKV